jgi:ABC-2 type transport system ATP-binding protein
VSTPAPPRSHVLGPLSPPGTAVRPPTEVAHRFGEFTHPRPGPPAIEAVALTKRYGNLTAVDRLSFRVEPGTVMGFLGPNGSGKTTTLRMLGGLVRPTEGRILLAGQDPGEPATRRHLGYMPADPVFVPHLSGRENLDVLADLGRGRATPDRESAAAAIALSPHDLDRPVGTYSSGMKQKLAIVAALQHRPEVVVLDEPANRLDPIAHRAFCDLVRAAAADGRTVLLSSHVLAEVEAVCDLVVLIRRGALLQVSTVADLRRHASRVVTLSYAAPPSATPACLEGATTHGSTVTGRIPAHRLDLVRTLLEDPAVVDLTLEPAPLEQVFLDLYAESAT